MTSTLKFAQVRKGASEYVADVNDLHIEVEKVARDYLGWQVFISRVLNDNGDREVGIYRTFADTRREAYGLAADYATADALLQTAVR